MASSGRWNRRLLGVFDDLEAGGAVIFRVEVVQPVGRDDDRSRDVVFQLQLFGGDEIVAKGENAPVAVRREADAGIVRDQFFAPEAQLVAGAAVDHVDAELLAPVVAHFGLIEPLDQVDQFADRVGDRLQPVVILVGVKRAGGRQQLDDRAERALRAEDRAAVLGRAGPGTGRSNRASAAPPRRPCLCGSRR